MGADIKAIHTRIKSVESTGHITKAMELVASAKIKKATEKMEASRYYRNIMSEAFSRLSSEKNMYTEARSHKLPVLYIVVAGDRGLAGGYNAGVFRSAMAMMREGDIVIPIGKRAIEYLGRRRKTVTDEYISVEHFGGAESAALSRLVCGMYSRGEIAGINLISTKYVSAMTQSPDITYILPIRGEKDGEGHAEQIEYEPDASSVMSAIIPDYVAGILYSAVAEAFAAELAARRSAMDTATKNANEMKAELTLKYNRARQGAITQEITEIVAGANA